MMNKKVIGCLGFALADIPSSCSDNPSDNIKTVVEVNRYNSYSNVTDIRVKQSNTTRYETKRNGKKANKKF